MQSENIHNHSMHSEKYSISIETQEMIQNAIKNKDAGEGEGEISWIAEINKQ